MRESIRFTLYGIGGLIFVLAISFILDYYGLMSFKFFAPRMEEARRQTFEQTKSYTQGIIQNLRSEQFRYVQADSLHRIALASIILHEVADYQQEALPRDLSDFIDTLKKQQ